MDPSKRVLKIFKMHMFQVSVDIFQYGTASIFRREPCNTHEMAKTVRKSYQLYYNTHPLEERPPWLVTFSIIVFIKSVYIGSCDRARNNRRLNITFTVQGRDGSSRDQFGAIYYVCPLQRADKCFLRSWKTWEVRPFVVSDRQQTAGSNCLSPIFISLIKRNVSRKDLLA